MSAVLVDELIIAEPVRLRAVPSDDSMGLELPESAMRAHVAPAPASRPLRLTDRGIAVIVTFFMGLVVAAAAVVVTSFLSVSDAPLSAPAGAVAAAATHG